MRLILSLLVGLALGSSATAQEHIRTEGPLSDLDFYRLVACAASPGQDCRKPTLFWRAQRVRHLRVAIARIDRGFPRALRDQTVTALDAAISEINDLDAGPRLRIIRNWASADIKLMLLDVPRNSELKDTGVRSLDGTRIQSAWVKLLRSNSGHIRRGYIVLSRDVPAGQLNSILLEELTQSLGLLTDIDNPYYRGQSIFSERDNNVTSLSGQDAMVIRRHYAHVKP